MAAKCLQKVWCVDFVPMPDPRSPAQQTSRFQTLNRRVAGRPGSLDHLKATNPQTLIKSLTVESSTLSPDLNLNPKPETLQLQMLKSHQKAL